MRLISKLLATLLFGVISFVVASPVAAAISAQSGPIFAVAALALVGLLCFTAPAGRRAWGRGSLVAGVLCLLLPVSMLILSAKVGIEMLDKAPTTQDGATAVGAALAGGVMVGAAGFFGLIFGAVFLIFGLVMVLGGRREVVVVERR